MPVAFAQALGDRQPQAEACAAFTLAVRFVQVVAEIGGEWHVTVVGDAQSTAVQIDADRAVGGCGRRRCRSGWTAGCAARCADSVTRWFGGEVHIDCDHAFAEQRGLFDDRAFHHGQQGHGLRGFGMACSRAIASSVARVCSSCAADWWMCASCSREAVGESGIARHAFCGAADHRERRAQFVAGVAGEAALAFDELADAPDQRCRGRARACRLHRRHRLAASVPAAHPDAICATVSDSSPQRRGRSGAPAMHLAINATAGSSRAR